MLIINVAMMMLDFIFGFLSFHGTVLSRYLTDILALRQLESGLFWPWQLVTYQFMHAGFTHLFFNMFALWMFGAQLERDLGTRRFATFYLLSGVGAGITHLVWGLISGANPMIPTVGASGSVYGVLLAFGLMYPYQPILMFPFFFPIPARFYVMMYAGIELISGILNGSGSGVAHFAHVGGALTGWLLLRFGNPVFDAVEKLASRRRGTVNTARVFRLDDDAAPRRDTPQWFRKEEDTAVSQEEVDLILEKIHRYGAGSLSQRERDILNKASKQ